MLSRPRKPPWKTLLPVGVLAIDPPGKVQQQLLKDAFEERVVAAAVASSARSGTRGRRPRLDRRVDVAERPFVGGNLAVGVHVPFARQQHELRFGELGVDQRERDTVKRQVPGRKPRILPRVRHRDHVVVVEVRPIVVAAVPGARRRRRLRRIALQPIANDVVVELLAPQHARQRLPLHGARRRRSRNGLSSA